MPMKFGSFFTLYQLAIADEEIRSSHLTIFPKSRLQRIAVYCFQQHKIKLASSEQMPGDEGHCISHQLHSKNVSGDKPFARDCCQRWKKSAYFSSSPSFQSSTARTGSESLSRLRKPSVDVFTLMIFLKRLIKWRIGRFHFMAFYIPQRNISWR